MTLSDYGISCDGPGGACRVVMAGHPTTNLEAKIAEVKRRLALRHGPKYAQANPSYWRDEVLPLIGPMGLERAVDEFGPEAVGWVMGIDPALILISPVLWRWS